MRNLDRRQELQLDARALPGAPEHVRARWRAAPAHSRPLQALARTTTTTSSRSPPALPGRCSAKTSWPVSCPVRCSQLPLAPAASPSPRTVLRCHDAGAADGGSVRLTGCRRPGWPACAGRRREGAAARRRLGAPVTVPRLATMAVTRAFASRRGGVWLEASGPQALGRTAGTAWRLPSWCRPVLAARTRWRTCSLPCTLAGDDQPRWTPATRCASRWPRADPAAGAVRLDVRGHRPDAGLRHYESSRWAIRPLDMLRAPAPPPRSSSRVS